ncbi:Uncharacterised protein [Mycobacteroides abscessus subsp. bolletii]|uniref:Uncharacterized protein n=1 Tax=Mycobacteroides abscessus subsp. bolletii TaxID=319705 RepID=A0A9Q7WJA3_9MYCO|nr:hypothetical protein [Mycobacteroides abscessus]SHT85748.1 Uncharacterised protein [Mycobacteroides abscessus subsp. bolletii]SHU02191.1 Uncharacterised protein [Mycobacteroides abscessus subsp. bolletii]SHX43089.1 Uncharacterised protein [Mycobacteroides abscessus subsp. bolletii]SKM64600.1 Uncharacterised protein [Mycobacteroides abscessus subsp. bolletii]SKN38860.1 Uncharacterised protein [Mycobacteroides abscessus subsp. bolletii]
MITAIVAQTKFAARQLADALGIDTPHLFGARCARAFEGLRVDRVLIHVDAEIPDGFMHTIYCTALKTPPRGAPILRVWVRPVD